MKMTRRVSLGECAARTGDRMKGSEGHRHLLELMTGTC